MSPTLETGLPIVILVSAVVASYAASILSSHFFLEATGDLFCGGIKSYSGSVSILTLSQCIGLYIATSLFPRLPSGCASAKPAIALHALAKGVTRCLALWLFNLALAGSDLIRVQAIVCLSFPLRAILPRVVPALNAFGHAAHTRLALVGCLAGSGVILSTWVRNYNAWALTAAGASTALWAMLHLAPDTPDEDPAISLWAICLSGVLSISCMVPGDGVPAPMSLVTASAAIALTKFLSAKSEQVSPKAWQETGTVLQNQGVIALALIWGCRHTGTAPIVAALVIISSSFFLFDADFSTKMRRSFLFSVVLLAAAYALVYLHHSSESARALAMAHIAQVDKGRISLAVITPYSELGIPAVVTPEMFKNGDNVGNLVWWEGTLALFNSTSTTTMAVWHPDDIGNSSAAIFSSANILWPAGVDHDYGWLSKVKNVMRNLHVPVLALGLGTDGYYLPTTLNANREKDLNPIESLQTNPELERFAEPVNDLLTILEASSPAFFVRGMYSERACHAQGFHRAQSNGCPSLFISQDLHLGQSLQRSYKSLRCLRASSGRHARFGLTIPGYFAPKIFEFMLRVLSDYPTSTIILQDQRDVYNLQRARQELIRVPNELHNLAQRQSRTFGSVAEWQEHYQTVDAVFGWRIHGAMVGVSLAKPVYLVAPDLRVGELAEAMMIPFTNPSDPKLSALDFDLLKLMQSIKFNGKAFDKNRKQLAKRYLEGLDHIGLPASNHLVQIAHLY